MVNVEGKRTVEITLTLNEKDAQTLRALCQNPHEAYQNNPEMMKFSQELFISLTDELIEVGVFNASDFPHKANGS